MEKKRTLLNYIVLSLKGIAMGAADVVPGVSGGTIAFISGIYEELIDSIKSINLPALKLILQGKFKEFWTLVNGNFLVALFIGIAISILTLSRLIKYLLDTHPILVWSFFLGLIVASAFLVGKKIEKWSWQIWSAIVLGTLAAFFITELTPASTPDELWFIFICGMIAICAMILPGVSGAFLLLMLGKYAYVLEALSTMNLLVIAVFACGAAIGLISFSNLLSYFLTHYHNTTVAVLAGFMIGSLNKVWPWKETVNTYIDRHGVEKPLTENNILPQTYEALTQSEALLGLALLMALAGFLVIYLLEKLASSKKEHTS